jgi:hypothetical protein
MPRGGKRSGAGRPRLSPASHLLRGTWRPSRHGVRPATSAAVLEMPVPTRSWAPDAADLAALGTAGRVLVASLMSRYDFAPVEGYVLLEAGHAADALAAVRAAEQPDSITQRLEMAWSKHYAALLAQLHLEKA